MEPGSKSIDVAVVGGGPAGTSAATVLAKMGLSTIILEARKEMGTPVRCAEVISRKGLVRSGVGDGEWIVHSLKGSRIFSPSGTFVGSRNKGFSIDRRLFDLELGRIAEAEGAPALLSTKVISASRTEDGWRLGTSKGQMDARGVVLATGPVSHLNTKFGLAGNKELMKGLGARISRRDDSSRMDFHVISAFQGGYGWYFPRGKEVNIGVVARKDLKHWFEWFMRKIAVRRDEIISWHVGMVPDGGPIEKFTGASVVAVGDCGGFCHPVSKGGIHCAILSGREGAKALADHLSGSDNALGDLDRKVRDHPAFSVMNIRRRDFLSALDDPTLDLLTSIAGGRDIQDIDPKRAVIEALPRPELYGLVLKGLALVQSRMDWMDYTF
ncbi:MAG: NAD(P)/FAD-dependent oxidoreductase [Thermoplasmatota archaeon]